MSRKSKVWAVILAAGDGTRLCSITTGADGLCVPKQFCSFQDPRSLLRVTTSRAEKLVPHERIVPVVAANHRRWWQSELADFKDDQIVIQPRNRGTAAGILLPLYFIFLKDPNARVLILPSDHFVEDEDVLKHAIESILTLTSTFRNRLVLFGMAADRADPGYGWIVTSSAKSWPLVKACSFVEKPSPLEAATLFKKGALWNTFMFVGRASIFMRLFAKALPNLFNPLLRNLGTELPWSWEKLERFYSEISSYDFSGDLLERAVPQLLVATIPPCGWSDLGTPERLVDVYSNRTHVAVREEMLTVPHTLQGE